MKRYLLFSILLFIVLTTNNLFGQANTYIVRCSMIKPIVNDELEFIDKQIFISFKLSDERISFYLKNLTAKSMRLNWNDAGFIKFGMINRVTHNGVKIIDRNNSQPSTLIPPGTTLNDFIIPSDNIKFEDSNWVTNKIYETEDLGRLYRKEYIYSQKNEEFGVFLPLIINGVQKEYTFTFKIESVLPKP